MDAIPNILLRYPETSHTLAYHLFPLSCLYLYTSKTHRIYSPPTPSPPETVTSLTRHILLILTRSQMRIRISFISSSLLSCLVLCKYSLVQYYAYSGSQVLSCWLAVLSFLPIPLLDLSFSFVQLHTPTFLFLLTKITNPLFLSSFLNSLSCTKKGWTQPRIIPPGALSVFFFFSFLFFSSVDSCIIIIRFCFFEYPHSRDAFWRYHRLVEQLFLLSFSFIILLLLPTGLIIGKFCTAQDTPLFGLSIIHTLEFFIFSFLIVLAVFFP